MEQRKNKNASKEETIAFNAKAKVESVVSIQIIMQHDEAQRQRKKLNNQEGHVKPARWRLNGLEYSMQPRYQDNYVQDKSTNHFFHPKLLQYFLRL